MDAFLHPDYESLHDPFLLPDCERAVERLLTALKKQEMIVIYGDYDIDGLTAAALLSDAFNSFGFKNVDIFIPNRFVEGYGMTVEAVDKIASSGASLIITVDCGSSSELEIKHAKKLGVDVIVTDHHEITAGLPPAVAVVNPKTKSAKYSFKELSGVGVAFKLVQALSLRFDGLTTGQEKWLLDLVALGTVCDGVPLVDENRTLVYWGLKVLSKTRRPGLKALMAIAGIDPKKINSRSLGFSLGPRMNAAGRLDTAQYALDVLMSTDPMIALEKAKILDSLNKSRRKDQDKILNEAILQASKFENDPVLVVSSPDWNHGIVGIVASKLLEKFQKPTFVLQELGDNSKGSARSYGDFSAIEALLACRDVINRSGGHHFAAGINLPTNNIDKFRQKVNDFYRSQKLKEQQKLLLPKEDAIATLDEATQELVELIGLLEPFGNGNAQPTIMTAGLTVKNVRKMGDGAQHVKLELYDDSGNSMQFLAFSAPDYFFVKPGIRLNAWYRPDINEWNNKVTVEGQLLHIEVDD